MAAAVIPLHLRRAVLARLEETNPETGQPYTHREVSAWLATEHGVKAGRMSVTRLRASVLKAGEQLIVTALREELRDAVQPAKVRLVKASKRLADQIDGEQNVAKLAAGVRALTAALDSLTKLSGVANPIALDLTSGGKPLADPYAQLAAAVARLAQEPDPGDPGPSDPKPDP